MFGFGYALVPIYNAICEATGINVLALAERRCRARVGKLPTNTQVDTSRTITVEFDANARGPWDFKARSPLHAGSSWSAFDGDVRFQNIQNRTMAAQAIPSYAPQQAMAHFNKLECFCFTQYTLEARRKESLARGFFVIDPRLPKDVKTITLSYTFLKSEAGACCTHFWLVP